MAVADFPREMFGAGGGKTKKDKGKGKGKEKHKDTETDDAASGTLTGGAASSSTSLVQDSKSDAASVSSLQASSVTGSGPETSTQLIATSSATTASTSGLVLTPQESTRSSVPPPGVSRPSSSRDDDGPTPAQVHLETMMGAGKGVSRIVNTGIKSPMNFCMGLARGFHNVPKLYNDDTVRTPDKVTGLSSGLMVAGKEFGLGFYDGISGLVTQPIKGASKEGRVGFLKGIGKGVGGLVVKPAAAVWSLPAYTMQGVHAEVRNRFRRSSLNYIIASRVLEGEQQLDTSTMEERKDILIRWQAHKDELKGFYSLKQKEKNSSGQWGEQVPGDGAESPSGPPKMSWLHARNISMGEMKKLYEKRDSWKKRHMDIKSVGMQPSASTSNIALEDEEFERAIRASVAQTSRGDPEEDARVEQSIRASVKEMKRIAEQRAGWKEPIPDLPASVSGGALDNITDEEYQALIEEAVRQSLAAQNESLQRGEVSEAEHAEDLRRVIEESKVRDSNTGGDTNAPRAEEGEDEEEQMRRAMEESEKEHREQMGRGLTEEQIVMEYVMKQSLAEEEFRRSKAKGKAVSREEVGDEEDDEDLRKAMEESLKMSHGGEGGPASSSGFGR
jgi:hypothetical protein